MDEGKALPGRVYSLDSRKLQELMENSPLAVIEWDHDFRVTQWSHRASEIFGYSAADALGRSPADWEIVHPEDRDAVEKTAGRLAAGLETRNVSVNRNVAKDGRIVYCEWYNSGLYDEAGKMVAILSLVNDLTERHNAERSQADLFLRYRFLADAIPQMVWTADPAGSFEYCNRTMLEYTGKTLDALVAGAWRDAMHPQDRRTAEVATLDAFAAARTYETQYRVLRHDGVYRWHLVRAVPLLDDDGKVLHWFGTCTDVDDRTRAVERTEMLAEASKLLADSLDVETTLSTIAALALEGFAEYTRIDLVDDDGRLRTAAVRHADPELDAAVRRSVGRYPTVVSGYAGTPGRVRGFPLFWPLSGPFSYESAADEGGLAATRVDSGALCVPLMARGAVLGALTFAMRGVRFDESDRLFAAELAYRSALALDNARLYQREHRVADTLQRAMLPAHLPAVADIAFSSAYSPAAAESEVGGDWYDAFLLSSGRIAVSIGDVTGHGLTAAVIMGEVRQSIRAAAIAEEAPVTVLARANHMLQLHESATIVTAVFGIVDPVQRTFRYATAGHPPPMLADGEGVRNLESSGLPLGLRDADDAHEFTVALETGSLLVLYTDGLIEFQRDLIAGEAALSEAVGVEYLRRSENVAQSIKQRVLARSPQTDDIAILTVSVAPFAMRRQWTLPRGSDADAHRIRREIGTLLRAHALPDYDVSGAEVATGELLANAVEHAPGDVEVVLDWSTAAPRLIVGDLGEGLNPTPQLPSDVFSERGRGLFLIDRLARGFSILREDDGQTHIVAVLDLARDVAAGSHTPVEDAPGATD